MKIPLLAARRGLRSKMKQDWDFYLTRVDDVVSSICVDLSLRNGAPFADKPRLVWVWLYFNAPRPDGLSSNEEAPELFRIGDELVAAIKSEPRVRYVGRITGAGRREFYFYSAANFALGAVLQKVMTAFPDYRVDLGEHDDPSWRHYLDLLYPRPQEMNAIQNYRVLAVLEKQGDEHSISRPIDHWAYFESPEARSQAAKELVTEGFTLIGETKIKKARDKFPFGLHFQRSGTAEIDVINEVTWTLKELVGRHGGEYDGWETPVIKH